MTLIELILLIMNERHASAAFGTTIHTRTHTQLHSLVIN